MSFRALVPPAAAMSEFSLFFESEPGRRMLEHQQKKIKQLLLSTVGHNCIQLSVVKSTTLCAPDQFGYLTRLGYAPGTNSDRQDDVWAEFESLPIASSCVDVVILHHVLDFSPTPHELLREVDRVMTDSGTLITVSFKPWSFWAIYQRFLQLRHGLDGRALSHCNPASPARLVDWLQLLNFEIHSKQSSYFLDGRMRWFGKLSRLPRSIKSGVKALLSPLGIYYVCVARKKTYARLIDTRQFRVRKPRPSVLGAASSRRHRAASLDIDGDNR